MWWGGGRNGLEQLDVGFLALNKTKEKQQRLLLVFFSNNLDEFGRISNRSHIAMFMKCRFIMPVLAGKNTCHETQRQSRKIHDSWTHTHMYIYIIYTCMYMCVLLHHASFRL